MTSHARSTAVPPFAVSQFTTWSLGFEDDLRLLAELGIRHIEVCERKLSTDDAEARDQLAMIADAGLSVTTVQPRVHALYPDGMCPDIERPVERMQRYHETIDRFCDVLPEPPTFVTITGAAPGQDFRRARETAEAYYGELASHAGERGARIAYEPLSPILMNIDTFVCTLDGAVELIDAVGSEHLGLLFDVWHLWQEPAIVERIGELDGRVFAVHVSDWPAAQPRRIADRVLPGDGVIDLAGILGALERVYDGPYCLEIFSSEELPDSLWSLPPTQLIESARAGFERAWAARR